MSLVPLIPGRIIGSLLRTGGTTGGGGNATVPGDAPIQPPQAFVDNIYNATQVQGAGTLDLSSNGITFYSPKLVYDASTGAGGFFYLQAQSGAGSTGQVLNLSGNAITDAANVNSLLASAVAVLSDLGVTGTIDLSGGTNAAPTQDAAVVASAGVGACNGSYSQRGVHNGKPFYNVVGQADAVTQNSISFDGTMWAIYTDVDGFQIETGDAASLPWLVAAWTIVGFGNDATISVTSTNGDQATLTAAGWTVTTN